METVKKTAYELWQRMEGDRTGILLRAEQFSKWTIPKVFTEEHRKQDNQALAHDFQALGAQCVNYLANRLVMTLFAPSRPFFRLSPTAKLKAQLEAAGVDPSQMDNRLSQAEKEASAVLDRKSIRPKMYELLKMLIVTGNGLLVLSKKGVRVLNMRNYATKRDRDGDVLELVIREKVHLDALDKNVRALAKTDARVKPCDKQMVFHYRVIKRRDGAYYETQWIDDLELPPQFDSKYTPDKLPYRAITWDLAAGDDYGTGLVEDFAGDFFALSTLSKAAIQGAILASEYRWVVNPMGNTNVEDFNDSENGAAIPGQKGDIELLHAGVDSTLQTNMALQTTYVNRIGAGFLLQTAVTRQAERVTAEEIRRVAEELEGGLGGAYSRIAVDLQVPLAFWTLKEVDADVSGSGIEPTIITGLDALSRSGDRDKLVQFGSVLGQMLSLPPQILDRLKLSAWINDLASAEGLQRDRYVITDEEYAAQQQRRQIEAAGQQIAVAQARTQPAQQEGQ